MAGPTISGAEVSPQDCSGTTDDCASWTCGGINGYQTRVIYPQTAHDLYDIVGEMHAYWNAHTSFDYSASNGTRWTVGFSFDSGGRYTASGSTEVSNGWTLSLDSGRHGPYYAREMLVPFRWRKAVTQFRCVYGGTGTVSQWYTWYYKVSTNKVEAPPYGLAWKFGADKSWGDGYWKWHAVPGNHTTAIGSANGCVGIGRRRTWAYQGQLAFNFTPWGDTKLSANAGGGGESSMAGQELVCGNGSTARKHWIFSGLHDAPLWDGAHALNSY
jgi:hypothetical protein